MGKHEAGFARKELEQALGIPARRIQFYTDLKLLVPGIDNPRGKGTTRLYSKKDVLQLLIVNELSGNGVPIWKIESLLRDLTSFGKKIWDDDKNEPIRPAGKLVLYNPSRDKGLVGGFRHGGSTQTTIDMGTYSSALVIDIDNLISGCKLV